MTDKQRIEATARQMIRDSGLINLSRARLCEASGIPVGSFAHVVGSTYTEFIKQFENDPEQQFDIVKARVDPTLRRDHIMTNALRLAKKKGYDKMSSAELAEWSGVSRTTIFHHFQTMQRLRNAVLREAVRRGDLEIIAQGLVNKSPIARRAHSTLKRKAARLLTGI